ncbi:MAG: DUF4097 family beta strand repeat-containing protein [Acidobacteriota bacterium]|nr:DUF4097 family beta strand repeat-containing protein [Acidobacteriota bacterium]MDW3229569.1 DUF4097 family beta strand repeat-containing protein [Acidobacteriota bacterium]
MSVRQHHNYYLAKAGKVSSIFFIVIFTLIIGAGCEEFAHSSYKYEESFEQTIPVKEAGSFSLSNINGSITVTSSPEMEVVIKATKYARWKKEDLGKVRIEVVSGEKSVIIDTVYERKNLQAKVEYEIKVPENMALELVKTVNGKVNVSGKFDRAKLSTTNGGITAQGDFHWLEGTTTNGSLNISQVKGIVNLKTTNGSIKVELDEVAGDLRAKTTNGSITIKLAGQPDAQFFARTTNGSIKVDYPVTVEGEISRRRVEGRIGSGQGPKIELKTTNGSISLLKKQGHEPI